MADVVWKGVYPQVFGCSRQLSVNKFFDPSTPRMRKVDDGKKRKRKKIMSFIVATNVVSSRPPERRSTGTPHARANFSGCELLWDSRVKKLKKEKVYNSNKLDLS